MHSKASKTRICRSERATQALELRKSGKTFREIGLAMGFSEQRAHRLVTQELARLNAQRAEAVAEVTRLELERLDALLAGVWKKAERGDGRAIDRALTIMARRAKLMGLDAPTKISPTTPDGQDQWAPALKAMTDEELAVIEKLHERQRQLAAGNENKAENPQ